MTQGEPAQIERWDVLEIPLDDGGPTRAEFRGPDGARHAESFTSITDASGRHLLRFMPDAVGEWTYRLEGAPTAGRFTCVPAGDDNHGPVRVHETAQLRYADGTPYTPLSTTWHGTASRRVSGVAGRAREVVRGAREESERDQRYGTASRRVSGVAGRAREVVRGAREESERDQGFMPVRTLAMSPFNRIRTAAPVDDEGLSRLDAQVRELRRHRVEVEVILFGAGPAPVDDAGHVKRVVSRLAAYRNVSWCLAADPDPALSRDLRRLAELVQEYDYGDHLLTVHAPPGDFDFGQPWLTHLSVSLENLRQVSRLRADYRKPVFVDRCGYEGDAEEPHASLTPAEMVARVWEGTVRGGHVSHGEWYEGSGDGEPWSAGGTRLCGDSPARLELLRKVLDEMPEGAEPIDDYRDAPTLAVPGRQYLQYLNAHGFGERRFTLAPGSYTVDVIDTWNMTVNTLQEPVEGDVTVRLPGTPYQAVRIRRQP